MKTALTTDAFYRQTSLWHTFGTPRDQHTDAGAIVGQLEWMRIRVGMFE